MGKKKFYGVRKGHTTGVFEDWPQCLEATVGFSGAVYKGFSTRAEAEAFVNQGTAAGAAAGSQAAAVGHAGSGRAGPAPTASNSSGGKFYAVARGVKTGVFQLPWPEVRPLVEGYPSPVYKGFNTKQEALDWLATQPGAAAERSRMVNRDAGGCALHVLAWPHVLAWQ